MTDNIETETARITGRQVLLDAVTLFKDAGTYIYELGKTAVVKIKALVSSDENDERDGDDAKHG